MQHIARQSARRGLTLIELLVVITILVSLMAYATSIIKPTLEDRKNREAAQAVGSYFSAAQARAASSGRPAGVWLERSANDDNKVLQMFAATSPPPLMGSTTSSRVNGDTTLGGTPPPPSRYSFSNIDTNNDSWGQSGGFDTTGDGSIDVSWMGKVFLDSDGGNGTPDSFIAYPLVRPGDEIRFNFQGPRYRIVRVKPVSSLSGPFPRGVDNALALGEIHIAPEVNDFRLRKPTGSLKRVPFQIFRQPKKSIVASVEFPTGIALDLALSGLGVGNRTAAFAASDPGDSSAAGYDSATDDRTPVVIMFSPTGGVDRVYFGNTSVRPVESIYLLLGQFEYEPTIQGQLEQLNDDRNRWMTIGNRAGGVTPVPINIDDNNPITDISTAALKTAALKQSRLHALSADRFTGGGS